MSLLICVMSFYFLTLSRGCNKIAFVCTRLVFNAYTSFRVRRFAIIRSTNYSEPFKSSEHNFQTDRFVLGIGWFRALPLLSSSCAILRFVKNYKKILFPRVYRYNDKSFYNIWRDGYNIVKFLSLSREEIWQKNNKMPQEKDHSGMPFLRNCCQVRTQWIDTIVCIQKSKSLSKSLPEFNFLLLFFFYFCFVVFFRASERVAF